MTTNTVVTIFAAVGVISGALLGVRQLLQPYKERLNNFMEWFEDFKRDWSGEEGAPGRDRVPGVMERLNKLDGELSQNGGKSTKDVVNQLLTKQDAIENKVDVLIDAFVEVSERLIKIETYFELSAEDTPPNSQN